MKCPNCGSEASGAFCAQCGAPLKGAKCRACGSALAPGANFCTSCGAPTAERRAGGSLGNPAWYAAGAALVLLVVVIMWPSISNKGAADEGKVPLGQVPAAAGGGANAADADAGQGPLTGTPREQADRLFNRIMTERENGDTTKAKFFLPMGIQAYQMAGELDADGLYHLSVLQAFGGDNPSALATAEKILLTQPNHLLGLSAAANAERALGNTAAARKYYQRFLAAYDSELKTGKVEYQDHSRMMPELKKQAEDYK